MIEQWIQGTDIFLVDLQLLPGRLKIFIDKPSGILLDECAALNRYLQERLEATGFNDHHSIEVSSPGMDAPFKVREQYYKNCGQTVCLTTSEGHHYQGQLTDVNDRCVTLRIRKTKNRPEQFMEFEWNHIKETRAIVNL
jgi:ribosome maturation factor RimP